MGMLCSGIDVWNQCMEWTGYIFDGGKYDLIFWTVYEVDT